MAFLLQAAQSKSELETHEHRQGRDHEEVSRKGNCANHREGFEFSQTTEWGVQTHRTPNVREAEVPVYILAARAVGPSGISLFTGSLSNRTQ